MTTPDPTTCSLLASAGYDQTHVGLGCALDDLADARSLLAAFLVDGDSIATLQAARTHLDRAASHVAVAVERNADGRVVPVVVSADVPEDRAERCAEPRKNCWSCGLASAAATKCHSPYYRSDGINDWIDATHTDTSSQCPPDADGCPGWEARP